MKQPSTLREYVAKLVHQRVFVLVDERGKLWVDWNLVSLPHSKRCNSHPNENRRRK